MSDRDAAPGAAPVRILVCTSCRAEGQPLEPRGARAGAVLARALSDAAGPEVEIVPVACMSVCTRPVTVGFAGGAWGQATTGTIYGSVPVASGESIQISGGAGFNRTITVGSSGRYSIELPVGTYTLYVKHAATCAGAAPATVRFSFSAQATSGSKCAGLLDVAPGAEVQACTFSFP